MTETMSTISIGTFCSLELGGEVCPEVGHTVGVDATVVGTPCCDLSEAASSEFAAGVFFIC